MSTPFDPLAAALDLAAQLESREADYAIVARRQAESRGMFKLLFFGGKDRVDVERYIQIRTTLDVGYVRAWIVEAVGEDGPLPG